MGIPPPDQCDLVRTCPTFKLLLTGERFMNVVVRFAVKQASDIVLVSESFEMIELVPEDAAVKIAADADGARSRS
jgi:hypothetical protein